MDYSAFQHIGIALGLGLVVGLQRERSDSYVAGIRTFPLITVFGAMTGLMAQQLSSAWIIAAGLIAVLGLTVTANYVRVKDKSDDNDEGGQTTEIAVLMMYLVGAYLPFGSTAVAAAVGGGVAVLLSLKGKLHGAIDKLSHGDVKAVMQFAAIALVVWPLLPNEEYGPYQVLNPREIWTMVVLIVGLSVTAYFVYKWAGKNAGTIAGGVLGGLISSTATTVTYAKRTAGAQGTGRLAALVIFIASTISFVRVLIEVGIVIPGELAIIAPPIIAVTLIMVGVCVALYLWNNEGEEKELPEPNNPAQLKAALIFGGLYAVILFAVAAAKDYFGQGGLYVVALISGLTDVDAITLSLSNTIKDGNLTAQKGWSLILLAALANMVFKLGMTFFLGSRRLAAYVGVATAITLVAGGMVIWLWPEGWVIPAFGG